MFYIFIYFIMMLPSRALQIIREYNKEIHINI